MTPRLKEVVSRLYKPAPGARQVFALSRAEAEELPCLPTVAVISVTAPERPPADLGGFAYLLRLSFADVDFLNPELSARARAKVSGAFAAEQAWQVREFGDGLPESIRSIVVHCGAGQSRSCGIALGLHKLYGYVIEMDRMGNANRSVLKMMTEPIPAKKRGRS